MTTMTEVPANIVKKIQTLAQMAAELRQGRDFSITRLTLLKSLCSDPEAAAKFALHLASLTQKKMKTGDRPSHIQPENWEQYQRLAAKAVREVTKYLKERTTGAESQLWKLLRVIQNAQGEFVRQEWGRVRRIHSRELLTVETALECVLRPNVSQLLAYDLARQYSKRYNARRGTGLIPESAPMVEEIAEFWGRHYLGRGWKKRVAK
jgi:hypothetical protein